jgi:hypothetical protein
VSAAASDRPTFCVYGADEAAFDRFSEVTAALCERHRRFGLVLMTPVPDLRERLARRYPSAAVLDRPRHRATWAKRLKVKCFIGLGLDEADAALLAGLKRRAIPVVLVGSGRVEGADRYIDDRTAASEPVARIVDAISPFLARHAALARSQRSRPWHRLERLLLRWLSPWRMRRLEDLGALRAALGAPQHILCLGNGPSSEDRRLLDIPYDRLFRVNDRWLERDFLAKPDVVFTGSRKTLVRVRDTIFAFSSVEIETMLLRRWLPQALLRRLSCFTPERAGILPPNPAEAFEPTNGAIMLATAVALEPRWLTVAGIDLFSDPRGAYPGADTTPNAYAAAHHPDSELRIVLEILDSYRGELRIVGDVLAGHWAAHRRARALAAQ